MKIKIDNKEIKILDPSKNIVEIAAENGIGIVAPCFRNKNRSKCCKVCIIEVNSERKYACCTKPSENMNIIYNRDDLIMDRNDAVRKYIENMNNLEDEVCDCGCDCDTSSQISGTSCCN